MCLCRFSTINVILYGPLTVDGVVVNNKQASIIMWVISDLSNNEKKKYIREFKLYKHMKKWKKISLVNAGFKPQRSIEIYI